MSSLSRQGSRQAEGLAHRAWAQVRRWLIVFLCVSSSLAFPRLACAAVKQVVSVAVLPDGAGLYRVSVLYPALVSRARGEAEVGDLWVRSGWVPSAIEWVTSPAFKGFPSQTSVEFTVQTLYPKGEFPVEALALAYKSWGGVDITFAHDGTFRYGGLPHYENADAVMDVSPTQTAMSVSVRVKNPNLRDLKFTALRGGPATQPPRRGRGGIPLWGLVLLALPVAGAAWIVVYAMLAGKRKRKAG